MDVISVGNLKGMVKGNVDGTEVGLMEGKIEVLSDETVDGNLVTGKDGNVEGT
jgi:hypothetical protein